MNQVLLKNGTTELGPVVSMVCLCIEQMFEEGLNGAIAFYELAMVAKDPNHKIFSQVQEERLKASALLQDDGRIHDSIRNIVLSGVSGEGVDLKWSDPVEKVLEA